LLSTSATCVTDLNLHHRACAYLLYFGVIGQHHSWATFWGWSTTGWGLKTLKFELGLDFLKMHLPTKSLHPVFNHSQVIVSINKQMHKHTKKILLKISTSSTMLCQWKIT